jgi:hypothetical protein
VSDTPGNLQAANGLDQSARDRGKPLTEPEITALPRRTIAVTAAGITLILVGLLAGLRPFDAWAPKAFSLINYIVGAPLDTFFFAYTRFPSRPNTDFS